MRLVLKRTAQNGLDGVLGELHFPDALSINYRVISLEHAYISESNKVPQPKLSPGLYKCVRGMHRLHTGPAFETFEITGVAGHSGILFHVGNYNRDSEGCVLLGLGAAKLHDGTRMLVDSRKAFKLFMSALEEVQEFELQVNPLEVS